MGRLWRRMTLAAILVSLVGSSLAVPAAAAGPEPSTTSIDLVAHTYPGMDNPVHVSVTGSAGTPTGTVHLVDVTGGGNTEVDSGDLSPSGEVDLVLPAMAEGTYQIEARYDGDATYATSSDSRQLVLAKATSTLSLQSSVSSIQTHHLVTLTATVSTPANLPDGSVTFEMSLGGGPPTLLGSEDVANGAQSILHVASLPVGDVEVTATWTGDEASEGSTSNTVAITVLPDTADATGVGLSLGTFYPFRDRFRDAVGIRGRRLEPLSVAIRIYSPTNRLVRSASIARVAGLYSYAWNGRTGSGALLAAGRYRVVQTLVDAFGSRKVVTSFVNLSHKRLVVRSLTLSKTVAQASRRSPAAIAWQFKLPAAATYRSIVVGVYGRTTLVPGISFGPHDFRACPASTWNVDCASRIGGVGPDVRWYNRRAHTTYDQSGQAVRVYAWANFGGAGAVGRARVVVSYGVLR